MLGSKKKNKKPITHRDMAKITTPEPAANALNIVGAGTTIKGEVNTDSDIRIDGTLIGTLNAKGKLIVGKSGKIDGEVNCRNADFSGEIKAKVNVSELLSLKSSTRLHGDVTTSKLAVEPGAVFTGSCQMSDDKGSNYGNKPFEATKPAEKK